MSPEASAWSGGPISAVVGLCGEEQTPAAADPSLWRVLAAVLGWLRVTCRHIGVSDMGSFETVDIPPPPVRHFSPQMRVCGVGGLYGWRERC